MDDIIGLFQDFLNFLAGGFWFAEFNQLFIYAIMAGSLLFVWGIAIPALKGKSDEDLWFNKFFITRHLMWACLYIAVTFAAFCLIAGLLLFIKFILWTLGVDVPY